MDGERDDATQEQFDNDQVQGEASASGYPEEEPSGAAPEDTGSGETLDRSGNERVDPGGSPPGPSGEGTQSTGNPDAAG